MYKVLLKPIMYNVNIIYPIHGNSYDYMGVLSDSNSNYWPRMSLFAASE